MNHTIKGIFGNYPIQRKASGQVGISNDIQIEKIAINFVT
jgi:hypothetical protein